MHAFIFCTRRPGTSARAPSVNMTKDTGLLKSSKQRCHNCLRLVCLCSVGNNCLPFLSPQVDDPSKPNAEGITALHNAVCAGHDEVVKFLVKYGCDINSQDSHGWYDNTFLSDTLIFEFEPEGYFYWRKICAWKVERVVFL